MSKTQNHLTFRVASARTLQMITELLPKYKSMTALLNIALDKSIPLLYAEVFGSTSPAAAVATAAPAAPLQPSVGRELKELHNDLDDVYVLLNIFEPMLAGLYNLAAEQLDGEPVNAEELRSGALSDLPEELAAIKNEISERHRARKGGAR